MKRKLRIISAVAALAAAATFLASTQASAYDASPERTVAATSYTPGPGTVGALQLKDKGISSADYGLYSIWGGHIHDNTIGWPALGSVIRGQITGAINTSNTATAKANAAADAAAAADAKATQALNKLPVNVAKHCDPVMIAHTGGSFKTGKTKVCEFNLPAGTWMINTSAFFARTVAGIEGVRPQMALRVGSTDTVFGDDYGTILGAEISATVNRELTGSAVKVVTVPAGGVTVEVFGFGYQDNTGDDGAKIAAAADVVAVKIAA